MLKRLALASVLAVSSLGAGVGLGVGTHLTAVHASGGYFTGFACTVMSPYTSTTYVTTRSREVDGTTRYFRTCQYASSEHPAHAYSSTTVTTGCAGATSERTTESTKGLITMSCAGKL
jgi:hypothetical protein